MSEVHRRMFMYHPKSTAVMVDPPRGRQRVAPRGDGADITQRPQEEPKPQTSGAMSSRCSVRVCGGRYTRYLGSSAVVPLTC